MSNPVSRFIRMLVAPEPATPMTYDVAVGGEKLDWYTKRDPMQEKYRTIYEQGGVVSAAVDCYPLFCFSRGYRLEGENEEQKKLVQKFHDNISFEDVMSKAMVDALVVKVGLAEIVPPRKQLPGEPNIAAIMNRPYEQFTEVKDDYGRLLMYRQIVIQKGKPKRTIDVPVERMFRLDLGIHLIARAYDDIMRDTDVAEGTAKSIKRHGFPRWHMKIGREGETISKQKLTQIEEQLKDLKANHEMATSRDVDIINIDGLGVDKVGAYASWSLDRLCAALCVPNELLGLGRGSTEATANVRLQAFYNSIGAIQKKAAREWNRQVVDKITGEEGAVSLIFNDVSPADELLRAQVVSTILQATPIDPWAIVTPDWCRDFIGIEVEQQEELPPIPTPPPLPPPSIEQPPQAPPKSQQRRASRKRKE